MRFNLIDHVQQITSDKIIAVKNVSLAEEYLADHFPTFPVLPGVMMLEAAIQAAGWLLHLRHDFARSMAVLKEAKNVKYGAFVQPGNALVVEVQAIKWHDAGATFKATGTINASQAISGRLEMAYLSLAEKDANLADIDRRLIAHNRQRWALIAPSPAAVAI